MLRQTNRTKSNYRADGMQASDPLPYAIDMSLLLALSQFVVDDAGIPYQGEPARHDPAIIAQYALWQWNCYLTTMDEQYRRAFLTQASWLTEHQSRIVDDVGGWPVSFPHPEVPTEGPWLSALVQGAAISVLVRAYQLTREDGFLGGAQRAVRAFERDILDGGVSAPLGEVGVFFEEVAVYPAAHRLVGFIVALFGLYDYVALTDDSQIEQLIHRSLQAMHAIVDEFDVGYWTRSDLLSRHLTPPAHLALQAALLEALANVSGCEHCSTLASRWRNYRYKFGSRLRYFISSRYTFYTSTLSRRIRCKLFPKVQDQNIRSVCVPVYGFPVMGGIRGVLAGVAQVTRDEWALEYLAQYVAPHTEEYVIHQFGTRRMAPWQFPAVWLYVLAGCCKLISLLRRGAGYQVILPQDGVYSAVLSVLAARLAGVRVVCMDHGNLTLVKSHNFRAESLRSLAAEPWSRPRRLFARLRYIGYWPSLRLFAWLAARYADHFLIPGIAGDGVEEHCMQLGIYASRITRFVSMIDMDRYARPDATTRAFIRAEKGIAADDILIAMVCRLAPEKGIDIALEGISQALSMLSVERRTRVRVAIAGDGPLRRRVEEDIVRRGLSRTCILWGETPAADILSLLAISDIFLYTSTRGACLSMAVLEAMASGCAVVASTLPMANVRMLAEGRGIAVPPGDAERTATALTELINNPEAGYQMGRLAREYVAREHSPARFKRVLQRVTYWSGLKEMFPVGKRTEAISARE